MDPGEQRVARDVDHAAQLERRVAAGLVAVGVPRRLLGLPVQPVVAERARSEPERLLLRREVEAEQARARSGSSRGS